LRVRPKALVRDSVDAPSYQRLLRLRSRLNALGITRLPGYGAVLRTVRPALFPALRTEAAVPVQKQGFVLIVPRRFLAHHLEQFYEPVTTRFFRGAVRPGACVVDVGAHIGYYTCLGAVAAGDTGTVHAVEPCDGNLELLRSSVARNRFSTVQIHSCAAAGHAAERRFHLTGSSDSHGFYAHPLTDTVGTTTVHAVPVADLVPGQVQVVKIDVEGAEAEVLEGATPLLERSPGATVIVEWNPECLRNAGTAPAQLPALMQSVGIHGISVLDDSQNRVRDLAEVAALVADGATDRGWHVNLVGRVE
jgi:FkbM family methyltransferase